MPAAPIEVGSHISLSGAHQPSLLEVTAQDGLLSSLQPAFVHLLKTLGRVVPFLSGAERRCGAELFLALHAALQHFCLQYHDSSFSEHYYDLKRIDLQSLKNPALPTGQMAGHEVGDKHSDLNDCSSVRTSNSYVNTDNDVTAYETKPVFSRASDEVDISAESNLSNVQALDPASNIGASGTKLVETLSPVIGNASSQVTPKQLNSSTRSKSRTLFSSLNSKFNVLPLWLLNTLIPQQSSHARSLAVLAVLPYLQQKISELYDRDLNNPQSGVRSKVLQLWPALQLCVGVANVCYYLRYMSGASRVCSLSHAVSGVTLVRRSEEEEEMQERALARLSWAGRLAAKAPEAIMDALEASAFLLQFLDWWYSSYRMSSKTCTASTTPEFPHQSPTEGEAGCPICHSVPPKQPTALAVSGLVFCYACILRHVRSSLSCPVTGYPASTDQLVRVYVE